MYVSSLLRKFNNLNNAKLVRKRTFAKFIDAANFPDGNNPWALLIQTQECQTINTLYLEKYQKIKR